jgi:uncharacterized phage protein gp47/JayE
MPSWQDYYDIGKATLQSRRPTLVVAEGDVTDAVLAGGASMATTLDAYANRRFRATFLDGAVGSDLTDRCHDRGVDRFEGAEAIGTLTLTRVSFAAGAGVIDAGTRVASEPNAATGEFQTYTLDEDAVFGGTDLELTGVAATCEKVGVKGNLAEDKITRFLDNVFDPTITVTNPGRFAGGEEIESDEALRDRTRGFFLTQARGTLDALVFGAKQVPQVTRVSIAVDSSGVITVYVADSEGNSSDAMVDAVTAELEHWRDASDVVYVTGGVVVPVTISLSLTVKTGVSIPALLSRVRQAVVSRVGRLNPGETLYRDMISAAVRDVDREGIQGVEIVAPAANVSPGVNEVLRTSDGLVNFV